MDWDVQRFALVGDPAHVDRLGVPKTGLCDFENERPVNLNPHFEASFTSIQSRSVNKGRTRKDFYAGPDGSWDEGQECSLRGWERMGHEAFERTLADGSEWGASVVRRIS